MKYLSAKKTILLLALSVLIFGTIWVIPNVIENMLMQKIVVVSYTILGIVAALIYFLINGFSWSIIEGEYEKEYYSHLKNKTALDEGTNLRPNPLKLTLCKRIYYAKLMVLIFLPIVLLYLFECGAVLLEMLFGEAL